MRQPTAPPPARESSRHGRQARRSRRPHPASGRAERGRPETTPKCVPRLRSHRLGERESRCAARHGAPPGRSRGRSSRRGPPAAGRAAPCAHPSAHAASASAASASNRSARRRSPTMGASASASSRGNKQVVEVRHIHLQKFSSKRKKPRVTRRTKARRVKRSLSKRRVPVSPGQPLLAAGGTLTGCGQERREFLACAERAQSHPALGRQFA